MDPLVLGRAMEAARPVADRRAAVLAAARAALFEPAPEPKKIDRYVIERRLGQGGMGVVWAARDLRLGRRVALKLLQHGGSATDRARMMREAQALARLSHPNVVEVFDVGLHDGQVFIAMELVVGETLAEWLSRPHPWREVVAVFLAAGAGLGAAHRAGLVHRDFKPSNVMVGSDDGRIRVMDFGLAQHDAHAEPTSDGNDPAASGAGRWLTASLTHSGQRVGTPAYMAPEQHDGAVVAPSADQFAFCASLWEALAGVRPFAGASLHALGAVKRRGELVPLPARLSVPRRVIEVVHRGLAASPRARHRDMDALLRALERASRSPRRALVLVGLVGLGVAGLLLRPPEAAQCEIEIPDALQRWSDDLRPRMLAAFDPAGGEFAAGTRDQTLAIFDERIVAWMRGRDDACTRLAPTEPARRSARACLDAAAHEIVALATAIAPRQPGLLDASVLPNLVPAASGLPDASECTAGDRAFERPKEPDDPERARRARALRERLALALAMLHTGDPAAAKRELDDAEDEVRTLQWPPLTAEHARIDGEIALDEADHERAERSLRLAYFTAIEHEQLGIASDSAISLVFVLGAYLARTDEALDWARHAEAAVTQLDDRVRAGELAINLGVVLSSIGRLDEARARFESAVELSRGPGDLGTATQFLAMSHTEAGEPDRARVLLERVIALRTERIGARHPLVATARVNLANALLLQGDYDAALAEHQTALGIHVAVHGETHPEVAVERANLGSLLDSMGDLDGARQQYATALGAFEATLGVDHPYVGATLVNLGRLDLRRGELDRAQLELERGRANLEQSLDSEHIHLQIARLGIAELELAQGKPERALATLGPVRTHCSEAERTVCGEIGFVRARALAAGGEHDAAKTTIAAAVEVLGHTAADDDLRRRIAAWRPD
jgi:tetratricopeptide (TPR) repeat protein